MFKTIRKTLWALVAGLALIAAPALAATPNYALSVQPLLVPVTVSAQQTASKTALIKFKLPFKAKLVGVSATARASGGTSPTLTVDVQAGGTSVLSAPVSVTAGTVSEATVSTATLADEATVTVDIAIGGTNPTWDDITVLLTLVRL